MFLLMLSGSFKSIKYMMNISICIQTLFQLRQPFWLRST